jgi:hypothetical protein
MLKDTVRKAFNSFQTRKEAVLKRIGTLGIGIMADRILCHVFNYLLYPFVIWRFGILSGGLVMTTISFLVCYGSIRLYDWTETDWLAIETIKAAVEDAKGYRGTNFPREFIASMLKRSDTVVFLLLSLKFDPFYTVLYMRHGANQYSGLSKRDWKIFLSSVFVSNVYWWLPAYVLAYTGVSIWDFLSEQFGRLR